MKKVGLIGGMSWESTALYYKLINEQVNFRLGGLHSAELVLYSVDFQKIEKFQSEGNWEAAALILGNAAYSLNRAGAEALVLCTNTMHKVAKQVELQGELPLLHIAEATAKAIKAKGLQRVGLLGTRYTMEEDFYRVPMKEKFNLETLIPKTEDRNKINDIIYKELCLGKTLESSRAHFRDVMGSLVENGAEGVIFGCTEIGLLVNQHDSLVPIFDSAQIHTKYIVDFMLG